MRSKGTPPDGSAARGHGSSRGPALVLAAIAFVITCGLAAIVLFDARADRRERLEWSSLLEGLSREVHDLDERVAESESRISTFVARRDSSRTEVEALLESVARNADYYAELAFQVELLLGNLRSLTQRLEAPRASDPVDAQSHLERQQVLSEEALRLRETRLREFQASNQRLRAQWISRVADRLGFSQEQYEGVVELYDRQTTRWMDLYERMSAESMTSTQMQSEISRIRADADRELTTILGEELKQQFRAGESILFPPIESAEPPRSR